MKHTWDIHTEKNKTLEKNYLNFQASELERTTKVVIFSYSWNTLVILSEEEYCSEVTSLCAAPLWSLVSCDDTGTKKLLFHCSPLAFPLLTLFLRAS